MFAAAPTLALSAFQNWDLLAVAATVGGLLAYVRRRPGEAAAWFAVGACLEGVSRPVPCRLARRAPAAGLADARADRCSCSGRRRGSGDSIPALIARRVWRRWFHFRTRGRLTSRRPASGQRSAGACLSALSTSARYSACLRRSRSHLWLASRVRDRTGTYPFVQACAVLTLALVLTAKASSPQYSLWMLPFFVFLQLRPIWWWTFAATDVYFNQVLSGALGVAPELSRRVSTAGR